MQYRVVKLSLTGRIVETIYADTNFEACKLVADSKSQRNYRVVVVDDADNWIYTAN